MAIRVRRGIPSARPQGTGLGENNPREEGAHIPPKPVPWGRADGIPRRTKRLAKRRWADQRSASRSRYTRPFVRGSELSEAEKYRKLPQML